MCHALMERLFCRPHVQICAVLAALNNTNYITLLMPECSVLRMDKFLRQCVGRFKVNRELMFVKDPCKLLYIKFYLSELGSEICSQLL